MAGTMTAVPFFEHSVSILTSAALHYSVLIKAQPPVASAATAKIKSAN
jgi:hypothetical protein